MSPHVITRSMTEWKIIFFLYYKIILPGSPSRLCMSFKVLFNLSHQICLPTFGGEAFVEEPLLQNWYSTLYIGETFSKGTEK